MRAVGETSAMWALHELDRFTIRVGPTLTPIEIIICAGQDDLWPRSLVDQDALLDGQAIHISRVETFATMHDPVGSNFGIVIRQVGETSA